MNESNWYIYAGDNPITNVDRDGKDIVTDATGVILIALGCELCWLTVTGASLLCLSIAAAGVIGVILIAGGVLFTMAGVEDDLSDNERKAINIGSDKTMQNNSGGSDLGVQNLFVHGIITLLVAENISIDLLCQTDD
jgi:hypothetical protein